jgi:hypothetical protein
MRPPFLFQPTGSVMNTEMKACNFRWDRKGCKVATFDLVLRSGIILKGATLQESHGKQWIGLPASRYEKPGGGDGWVSVVGFTDDDIKDRFGKAALAAALEASNA